MTEGAPRGANNCQIIDRKLGDESLIGLMKRCLNGDCASTRIVAVKG